MSQARGIIWQLWEEGSGKMSCNWLCANRLYCAGSLYRSGVWSQTLFMTSALLISLLRVVWFLWKRNLDGSASGQAVHSLTRSWMWMSRGQRHLRVSCFSWAHLGVASQNVILLRTTISVTWRRKPYEILPLKIHHIKSTSCISTIWCTGHININRSSSSASWKLLS